MALMEWKDEYQIGFREIDAQHRKLVDMINELHGAIRAGLGREAVSGVADDMVRYAYAHFSTEEHYMDRFGYPDQEAHRQEHEAFLNKADDIQERLRRKGPVLSLEVLVFLREWLTHHILVVDRKYAAHFRAQGLL